MKRLVFVMVLAFAGLTGAGTHGTALAAGGGNSDAAHACQQGGYASLHGSDGTTFKNAGECVSYAPHGGTFAHAQISAGIVTIYGPYYVCTPIQVTGTGFAPNSTISYSGSPVGINVLNGCFLGSAPVTDANGNFTADIFPQVYNYGNGCAPFTETITATDASGNSASVQWSYDGNQFCI